MNRAYKCSNVLHIIKDQLKVLKYMSKDSPQTCIKIPEQEEMSDKLSVHPNAQLVPEDEFIMRDFFEEGQISCSGQFIFKCSLNQTLWNQRDCLLLSSQLSFPDLSEERIRLVDDTHAQIPSTNQPSEQKRELQTQLKPIQRQEISSLERENIGASCVPPARVSKKRSKGKPTLSRRNKSKKIGKEKRDNNYVMKRAHTVLKKCCWSLDKSLRQITKKDADGSMDYFIRLLCRLEESHHLHDVIRIFHKEAELEIRKAQAEIEQEANHPIEIKHLRNVVAVLLRGKEAAHIFQGGERIQAMEIMYGKGLTLKKVYKMDRAIHKLKLLIQEQRPGFYETQEIPHILGIM